MKTSNVYFRQKLKTVCLSKIFLFDLIVLIAGSALSFFSRTKFFSPAGTSSLTSYFAAIPYISIVVLPSVFLKPSSDYEDFIPLSPLRKIILDFAARFCAYAIGIVLLLWMPFFVSFYGDVDFGAVAVSFFVLFLEGLFAGALCYFISETIKKNISSFVVSALVLFCLGACHLLSVIFNLPVFFTRTLNGISFVSHFDSASKGIFSLSDSIFFIAGGFFFLAASFIYSEHKKGYVWKGTKKIRLILVFMLFVLSVLDVSRFDFRIDLSKDRLYSVSKWTRKLLSDTDQTISLHFYKSGKLENLYPSIRNVYSFLKDFEKAGKNVSLNVTDCDRNLKARELLESYGIYPQRIRTDNSTSTEFIDVYSTLVIESGGNIQVIPFVLSPVSLEYQMDLKIMNLVYDFKPRVNILAGNNMTLSDELRLLYDWFINQGIETVQIQTEDLTDVSGPLFVIGENFFSKNDVSQIENYMKDGKGNVLFLVNPYSVDVQGDWAVSENLGNELSLLLSSYGVDFRSSMVMDYSCQRISMMSEESNNNYPEVINYPFWVNILPQNNIRLGFNMFWPVPLELSKNAVPFVLSSGYAYEEKLDFDRPGSLVETNPFKVKLQNVNTNTVQNYVLGAYVPVECNYNVSTNNGFFVISDPNFASFYTNGFIGGENGDFRNFMFLTGLFLEMNGQRELAELQQKTVSDNSLYKRNR